MLTDADIKRLLALGLTSDEIYCAIAEPGPWTLSSVRHDHEANRA